MKRIALLLLVLPVLFLALPAEASIGKWGPGVGGYNQHPLDTNKEKHDDPEYFKDFMLNGVGSQALQYLVDREKITSHQAEAIKKKIRADEFKKKNIQPGEVFADGMTFLISEEIRLTKKGQKIQYIGNKPEPAWVIEAAGIGIIVPKLCFNVAYKKLRPAEPAPDIDLSTEEKPEKPEKPYKAPPKTDEIDKEALKKEILAELEKKNKPVEAGIVPSGDIDWPKIAKWTLIIVVGLAIIGVGLYFLFKDRGGHHHDNDHGTIPGGIGPKPFPGGGKSGKPLPGF